MVPVCALAATTTWDAYDFKTCTHWSVTPDDVNDSGPGFAKASARAARASGGDPAQRWIVVEAWAMWKGREASYGVCRFVGDGVLTCMPDEDFPLAGAAYTRVSQAGAEDVYICSRDCDRSGVRMILDTAYEEETVFSKRALQTIRRFDRSCHEKAQEAQFLAKQKKSAGGKRGG